MDKVIKKYCCGCMLCETLGIAELERTEKGYYSPVNGDIKLLKKICPCYGEQISGMDTSQIWGKYKEVYYGWSTDSDIRYKASSGGVLTEIACYLLEEHKADYIIQTCADENDPTKTKTVINSTVDEVLNCCGSRYAISHSLNCLNQLDLSKKYAFIGKPCDVTVLKNYMRVNPEIEKSIVCTLSFFCAGLPSVQAQQKLLDMLKVEKSGLNYLKYRGDGWPGETTAIDSSGKQYTLDYNTTWSKILGRDIMSACRYCLDSIGELADISCGDAWYLKDNCPDFSERPGRNVIFIRSAFGCEILKHLKNKHRIELADVNIEEIKYSQACHYDRRATMSTKIFATKLMGKTTPKYSANSLKKYKSVITIKKRLRYGLGTIKRIIQGKI